MSKTRMLNKTVTTTLILLLTLSMLSIINIMSVQATSVTNVTPPSGPVGTPVTVTGTIGTFNGPWELYFDANGDGTYAPEEKVDEGDAVGNGVTASFVVPHAFGGSRAIKLLDVIAVTAGYGAFSVTTAYSVSAYGLTGTGTFAAEWTTEEKYSGSYSVNLTLPATPTEADAARVVIGAAAGEVLNDLTGFSFYWKSPTTGTVAGPYCTIEMDVTGDGTADTWVINTIEPRSGYPRSYVKTGPTAWIVRNLPTDNDYWHVVSSELAYNVPVSSPIPLAEVKALTDGGATLGSKTVLNYKVAIGESDYWPAETVYVDDITINDVTYDLEPVSRIYPPGETTTLSVSITGGKKDTTYGVRVNVTNPEGDWHQATFNFAEADIETAPIGASYKLLTYPTDFTGASTGFIGVYTVVVDQTAPTTVKNVATTTFSVGITDELEYQRTETVDIKCIGFTDSEDVFINITRPDGVKVVSKKISAAAGVVTDSWEDIPKNAILGTYTLNVTGLTSGKKDIQTFGVLKADLTVDIFKQPDTIKRTETTSINFTITYPNTTEFVAADLGSITVKLYNGTTLIATIPVTTYDDTNKWYASWKVPKDAALGYYYNFTFLAGSIVDKVSPDPNSLQESYSSNLFEVSIAELAIGKGVIDLVDPSPAYPKTNRTLTAIARFNITYPDNTFYTDADLKWVNVTIYGAGADIKTVSLTATDFNAATKYWTVQWKIPWNATIAADYKFTVKAGAIVDKVSPDPNTGPAAPVSSATFEVRIAHLIVDAIYTIPSPDVPRGSWLTVYFTATYPDGSPVTTGSPSITLIRPDETEAVTLAATYSTAYARFQASWYLPDYEQLDNWTAKLAAYDLSDTAPTTANTGPIADVTTTFNVTTGVTLEIIYNYLTITIKPILDDIFHEVTRIEAKLDEGGSFYVFVDNWFTSISGTLSDMVTTYLDPILTGVNDIKALLEHETYGLAAIKNAVDAINFTAIDNKLGAYNPGDTVASLLYDIKIAVSAINWADVQAILSKVTNIENEIYLAPSELKFDFGTATSLWEHDYIQITETTAYSADLGYGWTNTTGLAARDRGAPDYTRRDFVFSPLNRTFQVDLPNGNYTVIITMGDQNYAHDNMQIYAEGTFKTNVTTTAATYKQIVFTVTVTDGSLELTFVDAGGVDVNWVINSLIIQRNWK